MYHKLILIGNLGRDPEMRYTPSGQAVCNFPVATNRQYTNSEGEQVSEVTWFRLSAWGRTAELCNQYLHKGSKVYVEAHLNADKTGGPRIFEKSDGTTAANFEATVEMIRFLSPKEGEQVDP